MLVTVRAGTELADFSANLRVPILIAKGRGHRTPQSSGTCCPSATVERSSPSTCTVRGGSSTRTRALPAGGSAAAGHRDGSRLVELQRHPFGRHFADAEPQ
ncbi:MAG: hypothetical protein M3N56_06370, partial [Actinomycetota bacterium]|nr:hypothetical protein [Actinomycetota bacterium]